jgi:glycerol kinase
MQLQADLLGQNVTVCGLDTCWGVAKGVMKSLGLDRSITEIESKVKEYNPCEANKEIAQKAYKKWSASKPRFALWNQ